MASSATAPNSLYFFYSSLFLSSSSQSPSDPLIQKLEDAVHRIFVRRSAPDWLPFVPGASYWVPPPGSGSQSHGIAQLVAKLANPLANEESLSTNSSHGWPSSDYFLKVVWSENRFWWCAPCCFLVVPERFVHTLTVWTSSREYTKRSISESIKAWQLYSEWRRR